MSFKTYDVSACYDCIAISANGTLGQGDDDADRTHAESMESGIVSANEDEEFHFSSTPCGVCGTYLAGDRVAAVLMQDD